MTGLVAPVLAAWSGSNGRSTTRVWPAHVDAGQLELALDEPRLQCARCDAFRRHHLDPRPTTAPCATAPRICRPATMSAHGEGHRLRHPARAHVEGDRAVLHHQVGRQGHRPWPEHRLRLRQAVRRHAASSTASSGAAPSWNCGCRGRPTRSSSRHSPMAPTRQPAEGRRCAALDTAGRRQQQPCAS